MPTLKERAQFYAVDQRGGGGLAGVLDRAALADRPTLLICLGGAGTEALLRAKRCLRQSLRPEAAGALPGRLRFLAIDADAEGLEGKRVDGVRLCADERFDLSVPGLDGFMRAPETISEDWLRNWLSADVPADATGSGAGGIRQRGRFMLMTHAADIAARIRKDIDAACAAGRADGTPFAEDDPVYVYILTGVAGGTGSGAFLDTAYLTRYVAAELCRRPLRLRGMVFMPDVNEGDAADEEDCERRWANGYAALKELDFWMNAERGRSFEQRYASDIAVDTAEKPFDLCFLVSARGEGPDAREDALQSAGEILGRAVAMPGFEDFVDALMRTPAQKERACAANYVYAALGMDERRAPVGAAAEAVACRLLERVEGLSGRDPADREVGGFFYGLKLDSGRGVRELFGEASPSRSSEAQLRSPEALREEIAARRHGDVLENDALENELNAWVEQSAAVYAQRRTEVCGEVMDSLRGTLEGRFSDPGYGPFYAQRMLCRAEAERSDLLKLLAGEIRNARAFLDAADGLEDEYARLCGEAKNKARSTRFVPLVAGKNYDEYVEAAFKLYEHRRSTALYKELHEFYRQLSENVQAYNDGTLAPIAALLGELNGVLQANAGILAAADEAEDNARCVGGFAGIGERVDEAFRAYEEEGTLDALVGDFLRGLLAEREQWLGEDGDPGESLIRFAFERFGGLMGESLEDALKRANDLPDDDALEEYILNTVLPGLQEGAQTMYAVEAALDPTNGAARRALISCPSGADRIGAAVARYVTDRGISADVVSAASGSPLLWMTASAGLPLYACRGMAKLQAAYDARVAAGGAGLHLRMGKENWLERLPSLLPETVWPAVGYADPALAEKHARARALIADVWTNARDALLPRAPGPDGTEGYVLGEVDRAAYDHLIEGAPLDADAQARLLAEGASAAASIEADSAAVRAFVERAAAFAGTAWTPADVRFKTDAFAVPANDPEPRELRILAENALLTPDLLDRLAAQYGLRCRLLDAIEAHRTVLEAGDREDRLRDLFARALAYGLYKPVFPRVYQLDVDDTGLQSFALMSIQDYRPFPLEDRCYAMFKRFATLDESQREAAQKVVERREARLDAERAQGGDALRRQYAEAASAVEQELEARLEAMDGDPACARVEIRQFYEDLRGRLAALGLE